MQAVGAKSGAVPASLTTDRLNILRGRPNIGRSVHNRVQLVICKVTPPAEDLTLFHKRQDPAVFPLIFFFLAGDFPFHCRFFQSSLVKNPSAFVHMPAT
jgi:hypothetical protein